MHVMICYHLICLRVPSDVLLRVIFMQILFEKKKARSWMSYKFRTQIFLSPSCKKLKGRENISWFGKRDLAKNRNAFLKWEWFIFLILLLGSQNRLRKAFQMSIGKKALINYITLNLPISMFFYFTL